MPQGDQFLIEGFGGKWEQVTIWPGNQVSLNLLKFGIHTNWLLHQKCTHSFIFTL